MTNLDGRLRRLEQKVGDVDKDLWLITVDNLSGVAPACVLAHTLLSAQADGTLHVLLSGFPEHTIRRAMQLLQGIKASERLGIMQWERPTQQAPRILNALACLIIADEVDLELYRGGYLLDRGATELRRRSPDMDAPNPAQETIAVTGDFSAKFNREVLVAEWSGYTDLHRSKAEHLLVITQVLNYMD